MQHTCTHYVFREALTCLAAIVRVLYVCVSRRRSGQSAVRYTGPFCLAPEVGTSGGWLRLPTIANSTRHRKGHNNDPTTTPGWGSRHI